MSAQKRPGFFLFAIVLLISLSGLVVLSDCSGPASPTTSTSGATTSLTASPAVSSVPTSSRPATSPAATTSFPTTSPGSTAISPPRTPAIPPLATPQSLIRSRANLNAASYVVFAWNDLGMHCANPTYDKAVLLPPYNTFWAQVVKRGSPPQIVTAGLTVEYKVLNNTYSYGKQGFSGFWDNANKLFGLNLARNTGLNLSDPNLHNGLSGAMVNKGDHFEAVGVPLTPINDDGTWNPYQVGQITVKDSTGKVVAQTDLTLPISDEINCARCHGADPFQDILQKHDQHTGTKLTAQEPVLCASCHGDPALGSPATGGVKYLSEAVHGFHSTVSPQPTCYDCHPGQTTKCSRSLAHTAADGNCTTCHGNLAQVSSSITGGRVPWASEPTCVSCHPGVAGVDTGSTLYRNSTGHGGLACASCHSSPHAMVPTSVLSDNYQALQYQGAAKAIGSCGACHPSSRGAGVGGDFVETHGGNNPRVANACFVCHTSLNTSTAQWPHSFQWKATQGTGSARGD